MRRRQKLRYSRCALAVAGTILGVACQLPGPTPAPRPASPAPQVVPAPASLVLATGLPFEILRTTSVFVDTTSAEVRSIGEMLASLIRRPTSFPVAVAPIGVPSIGAIILRLAPDRTALGEEGYELNVTSDSVRLVANRPAGLFRGIQTIRQLLPADIESDMGLDRVDWPIPALTIVDQPRFAWRGAMLDVARHFFTVREVEQYIDILALYKMNVLHLHLSDDQGWRIVINSRPKLTAMGSLTQVGGGPGGFYTQQDYQDIVRYAQARYITIVPEIDMPGHINAGLAGYPELACSTRPPGLYSGTDVGWSTKKMIGWEEITKARLNPTTLAHQWKSDSATAALAYGSKLILSPAPKAYLDMKYTPSTELGLHWAGYVEVRDSYDWDPAAYMKGVTERDIVGVEAPMWSETLRNITAVEYLAMPRLPAIAEVGWTPQTARSWESFRARLVTHEPRWRYLGINYYRSPQLPW